MDQRVKEVKRLAEVHSKWQSSDAQCCLFNTQACGLSASPQSLSIINPYIEMGTKPRL